MPAKSKAQQRAAAMALAAKEGDWDVEDLSGAAKDMYDSMSKKELEKLASTDRDELPDKKEASIKEGRARNIWNLLKGGLKSLVTMSSAEAIKTLSELSPAEFNKLEKAVRAITNVISQADRLSSGVEHPSSTRSIIKSGKSPEEIIGALTKSKSEE